MLYFILIGHSRQFLGLQIPLLFTVNRQQFALKGPPPPTNRNNEIREKFWNVYEQENIWEILNSNFHIFIIYLFV
jgi:hypothetical protein